MLEARIVLANTPPSFVHGDAYTQTTAQYFAGAGDRLPAELRNGKLVKDVLAEGDIVVDDDPGSLLGIAITAIDERFGRWQYTSIANPTESDWVGMIANGPISETSALLLKADETTRVRLVTSLIPHHEGTAEQGFLPLGTRLSSGLRFLAWDQTSGQAGGRADTSNPGPESAFSALDQRLDTFFEVRLWRHFNKNASLNVYTLEAEFKSLAAANNPAFEDRSTADWTGITVFLSPVPPRAYRYRGFEPIDTSPLYRMYFGVQFNSDGTETDMGYRYLTSNASEADALEGYGPEDKRSARAGAYFRELGVNNGTGAMGYLFTTQKTGTVPVTQIYRTDAYNKPTRPLGTREGDPPTTTKSQEQGDHVYTTNVAAETSQPGTWRVEDVRGFAREIPRTPPSANASPRRAAPQPPEGVVLLLTVSAPSPASSEVQSSVEASPPAFIRTNVAGLIASSISCCQPFMAPSDEDQTPEVPVHFPASPTQADSNPATDGALAALFSDRDLFGACTLGV